MAHSLSLLLNIPRSCRECGQHCEVGKHNIINHTSNEHAKQRKRLHRVRNLIGWHVFCRCSDWLRFAGALPSMLPKSATCALFQFFCIFCVHFLLFQFDFPTSLSILLKKITVGDPQLFQNGGRDGEEGTRLESSR